MAEGASAPRSLPRCYRPQPAVPLAGGWRLGATDDAHAADRECGVLPALPSDSRGGGGARARPASYLPLPILHVVRRQAAVRGRWRASTRDDASEGRLLDRSAVLASLGHGVRYRRIRQGIRAERIPLPPRLVAQ